MSFQRGKNPRRRALCGRGGAGRRMRVSRSAVAAFAALATAAAAPPAALAADAFSIAPAVDRGVAQLESVQLPDGGFPTLLPVRDSATAAEALRLARPESAAIARVDAFL